MGTPTLMPVRTKPRSSTFSCSRNSALESFSEDLKTLHSIIILIRSSQGVHRESTDSPQLGMTLSHADFVVSASCPHGCVIRSHELVSIGAVNYLTVSCFLQNLERSMGCMQPHRTQPDRSCLHLFLQDNPCAPTSCWHLNENPNIAKTCISRPIVAFQEHKSLVSYMHIASDPLGIFHGHTAYNSADQ
jgi:hypothetical protein